MEKKGGVGDRTFSRQLIYEDFQLSSDWTQDSNSHVLLVNLPGFKKEQLKVEVDNYRTVTVSGETLLNEDKCRRFKQVFSLPKDSDVDKIRAKFDGGHLSIVIPKKAKEEEFIFGFAESAMEMISKNKAVFIAAVLGLSVGLCISQKLRLAGH